MVRILSGAVLLLLAGAAIWWLPPLGLLAVVECVLLLAFLEYARLAVPIEAPISRVAAGSGTAITCAAAAVPGGLVAPVLMAVTVGLAAVSLSTGRIGPPVVRGLAAGLFPALYLGLPLGALVSIRAEAGREALVLLVLTVVISDTAQYYVGTLLGRTRFAPSISPKKSVEGAVGGLIAGTAALVLLGRWALPGIGPAWLAGLGPCLVGLGILGDLFESMLKRSAGVKDSSMLVPGHGGVLDRIDALLFAAPAYYLFLRYGP